MEDFHVRWSHMKEYLQACPLVGLIFNAPHWKNTIIVIGSQAGKCKSLNTKTLRRQNSDA